MTTHSKDIRELNEYLAMLKDIGRKPLVISQTLYEIAQSSDYTDDDLHQMAADNGFAGFVISMNLPEGSQLSNKEEKK